MPHEDWNRAKQIFLEALERTGAERTRFVAEACGDDRKLHSLVERLLAAHDEAGGFLDVPTGDARAAIAGIIAQPPEGPGTRIGPYKLLQAIGEGGFGVVYMAEQETPIRRRVALKIIKPGMDTRQVIARFETERQALALMDHPNIARVLDAGATESGRPYFVMELVKGVPITEYCDANRLGTRERLELFVQVCHAVHHAHEKGLIHRDIKPTNVMVTLHDGTPVPKVIDFGVAKATSLRLTEKTLFTAYGACIGTPTYMSPEQAEMSGLEVDRRSDVYSLGVLLYELLTGTTPFDAEALRKAAFVELLRIIREEEPPTPSARLSTLGDRLVEVARNRHAEPYALARLLRGDLDWIAMKALEKDRRRRYDSVTDLVEDVGHYFANEPVIARRPSRWYRAQKLVKRQRGPITAAAGIGAALVLGGALALRLAVPARTNAMTERRVWEGADVSEGSISPDGRLATTGDWSTGNLVIRELQSGEVRPLTRKGSWADSAEFPESSIFSPDGRRVAYAWLTDKGRDEEPRYSYELRVVDIDGLNIRTLQSGGYVQPKDWSADGRSIAALIASEKGGELALVDAETGQKSLPVTLSPGVWPTGVRFSPDGRFIAYDRPPVSDGQAQPDIYVAAVDGSVDVRLVDHPAADVVMDWSPDGRFVIFASSRSERDEVWAVPVDGASPTAPPSRLNVSLASGLIAGDGFTADGRFFYHAWNPRRETYVAEFDPDRGSVQAPSAPVSIAVAGMNHSPAWSPDGSALAFLRHVGPARLVIRDVATGSEREMAINPNGVRVNVSRDSLQWAPDGSRLVFSGNDWLARHGLHSLDLATGRTETTLLARNDDAILLRTPRFSPDGRFLYYLRQGRSGYHIVRWSLESGERRVLYSAPADDPRDLIAYLAVSPDGRWLAFGVGRSPSVLEILVMPSDGGETRRVFAVDPPASVVVQDFTADSGQLLFTRTSQLISPPQLWRVPIDGGAAQPVATGLRPYAVRVHPNGRQLAVETEDHYGEVWEIDNLLAAVRDATP